MSIAELSRPQRREPITLSEEQEARVAIANLAQQLLDLHIREPLATPAVYVLHGAKRDERAQEDKWTIPYMPKFETYAVDTDGTISLHFEETPRSLYLNIANMLYPQPFDNISVEFRRRSNEEIFMLVDGPTLWDGSPAPAETIRNLAGEGQTLVDLIKQA